jgi:succinate dehydrogenase/fumarate reductase flavoprotein subunit
MKTLAQQSQAMAWPFPIEYDKESELEADVLVLGGGIAGCFAAITAAKKGQRVALVEKGATTRSGSAGSGIDHWRSAATNPCSKLTPEELAEALVLNHGGYSNGINNYITCREGYDTFLELEKMGVKVRDSEDEFSGAEFRDEKTKLLFSYDYGAKDSLRVWGTGLKPALYKECKRLGVKIYDRVMATCLLTEGGEQGERVVGATGVNAHTGGFFVFKGKATILCMSRPERLWIFSTEFNSLSGTSLQPPNCMGDGFVMAWKAGAEFTMMEHSRAGGGPFQRPSYGVGNARNTWFACTIVDAKGREVPWVDRDGRILKTVSERLHPAPGQKFFLPGVGTHGLVKMPYEFRPPKPAFEKGDFTPPFYADLASMPEHERRAIFGLMVGQEGKTNIPVYHTYTQAGFDPDKDMLQCYDGSWIGVGPPQWRTLAFANGGLVTDWKLMTNIEGLFASGLSLFSGVDPGGCSSASTTGKYAARKACEYALRANKPVIDRGQVEAEKARIYAPIKHKEGIEWKELSAGIARVMQDYCGKVRNETLLNLGLKWLDELKEKETSELYARNPHELMRALESLTLLTLGEMVIHASLARRASSGWLDFRRSDYPEMDPPDWQKFITTRLENGKVKAGELPFDFWGPLKENYEAHCGL